MKGEPQKFGVQAEMGRRGPRPLTSWAARQGVHHVHLFRWDLQYQVAQMLSFEPYLKDNCLQQHQALHRLRMSTARPGRGWAAKPIPAATSDFSSCAHFCASGRLHGSAAPFAFWLFCARPSEANLHPVWEGRARQSLRAKDLRAGGSVAWPDLPFACVVFGNSLQLSGPQFPNLKNRLMTIDKSGVSLQSAPQPEEEGRLCTGVHEALHPKWRCLHPLIVLPRGDAVEPEWPKSVLYRMSINDQACRDPIAGLASSIALFSCSAELLTFQ